jgi:hypothetical protein
MADLIDIRPRLADRQRSKLPLDPFGDLVHALRIAPVPTLIEALVAARTLPELVTVIDGLAGVVIRRTTPDRGLRP